MQHDNNLQCTTRCVYMQARLLLVRPTERIEINARKSQDLEQDLVRLVGRLGILKCFETKNQFYNLLK